MGAMAGRQTGLGGTVGGCWALQGYMELVEYLEKRWISYEWLLLWMDTIRFNFWGGVEHRAVLVQTCLQKTSQDWSLVSATKTTDPVAILEKLTGLPAITGSVERSYVCQGAS